MRKRELAVEAWMKDREVAERMAKDVGYFEYLGIHRGLGHELKSVVFEHQMARAWRDSGLQVYEFDRDFSESILDEKWADLLPDCIGNRPHDCFYLKLPCDELNEGVLVYVIDTELIASFDASEFPDAGEKGVHFSGTGFNERAIVNTGDELVGIASFQIARSFDLMLDDTPLNPYPQKLMINAVAYLCSANADIVPVYSPPKTTRENKAKRRSAATWSEVGFRIGSELRSYRRSVRERGDGGGTVRPHMRRAHWHHYWTGPLKGERKLVLKWVAPTMVNVKGAEIASATLHHVR